MQDRVIRAARPARVAPVQHDPGPDQIEPRPRAQEESGAIGRMPQRDGDARLAERLGGRLEPGHLLLRECRVIRIGVREVRHESCQADRRQPGQVVRRRTNLPRRQTRAAHTGVHLEVKRDHSPPPPGHPVQYIGLGRIRDALIQPVVDHQLRLRRSDRAQDQDARRDPGLPENDSLLGHRHAEPCSSGGQSGPRNRSGAMPVGIGLYHRHHLGGWPGQSAGKQDILPDGAEIYFGPGFAHRLTLLAPRSTL